MGYYETECKPIDLKSNTFSTLVAQLFDLFFANTKPHLNDIFLDCTKSPIFVSSQWAVHKVDDAEDIDRVAIEKLDQICMLQENDRDILFLCGPLQVFF